MPYHLLPNDLSFELNTTTYFLQGVSFKPDGTKMYTLTDDSKIREYDLSTPWSIGTSSYLQMKDVSANTDVSYGMYIRSDGLKMYMTDRGSFGKTIGEYDLNVAWDITSAVFLQLVSIISQDTKPVGVHFKPDGTRMYIAGYSNFRIYEYSLNTPWDIASAVYTRYFGLDSAEGSCISFKPDGTHMYTSSTMPAFVSEYVLSTAWDVSSAILLSKNTTLSTTADVVFSTDGSTLYLIPTHDDKIREYGASISKIAPVKSA